MKKVKSKIIFYLFYIIFTKSSKYSKIDTFIWRTNSKIEFSYIVYDWNLI